MRIPGFAKRNQKTDKNHTFLKGEKFWYFLLSIIFAPDNGNGKYVSGLFAEEDFSVTLCQKGAIRRCIMRLSMAEML